MAALSDYTSGRISLANGSTTVTGTGTLFNVAKFREGDTLQIQNLTAVIATVNSDTSLTLTAPWTGTTLTNAIYRARYLPDGARVTAQATTLIELMGNGNLQSIAGLTSAANKGVYFSGAGAAATFDLTANSRELLGAANDAAFYAALGEIPNGQLPNRLTAGNPPLVADCNAITETGWYRYDNNTLNTPFPNTGIIFHLAFSNNQARQWAGAHSAAGSWSSRINVQGAWATWFRDYTAANIIGTVSQTAGVPTGGIIQRGSNANGEFVRFADGTQFCWRVRETVSLVSQARTEGGVSFQWAEETWNFPASFNGLPSVNRMAAVRNSSNTVLVNVTFSNWSLSSNIVSLRVVSQGNSILGDFNNVSDFASGRWL